MIKIIPAIDIKDGKVVRLEQGLAERETVYAESALEVAKKWASAGAELIHVVDLDGAFCGRLKSLNAVKEIADNVDTTIELGGGIRDEASIKAAFDSGVDKVVIGTKAFDGRFLKKMSNAYKDRIVVGIDARGGVVFTKGWLEGTKTRAIDLVMAIEKCGIGTINYTDISRDGMLSGPNMDGLKEVLRSTRMKVVVSGGVSTLDDVRKLKDLESEGLTGIIIGKALYEGKIDLAEAIKVCKG